MKFKYFFLFVLVLNFLLSKNEIPMPFQFFFFITSACCTLFLISAWFSAFLKYFFVIALAVVYYQTFGFKFTTESSISLLFGIGLLKILELESDVDYFHMFLIVTLSSVGLIILNPDILYLCLGAILLFVSLYIYLKIIGSRVRFNKEVLALSFPAFLFSIVLFLFFPRFTQGFYGNNLSQLFADFAIKKVSIESLGEVNQSQSTIFKAYHLPSAFVDLNKLYWKERVFITFKNESFYEANQSAYSTTASSIPLGETYTIKPSTLFFRNVPHLQEHSLIDERKYSVSKTLDSVIKLLPSVYRTSEYSFSVKPESSDRGLPNAKYLSLGNLDPQKIKRAFPLSTTNLNNDELLAELKNAFKIRNFVYSKNPKKYRDSMDFIDSGSTGYCVHFAFSFALLLRAHNFPTRIVSGYQGGEINPYNNSVTVRELDGHMWVEYYHNNNWHSFDPTELVSPGRSSVNMNDFLNALDKNSSKSFGRSFFVSHFKNFFFFVDFALSELDFSISSIDYQTQQRIIKSTLTLKNALLLIVSIFAVFLINYLLSYFRTPWPIRNYRSLIKQAAQYGIVKNENETASEFFNKLSAEKYPHIFFASKIIRDYNEFTYMKENKNKDRN